MTEHTPLPWELQVNGAAYNIVADRETRHHLILLNMEYVDADEFEANAKFVVRASNSHADLLEALEAINAVFATHTNEQINVDWIRSKVGQAIEKAKEGDES